MKSFLLHITLFALLGLAACSTDVDLYADYKDIPIVYGLIETQADTNYIKITRAFCGDDDNPINANVVASIYDSSNYPGKLEVFIDELKSTHNQAYKPTGRRFYLDTITIHNKKEGLFYAPHQKLYYTTEKFTTNTSTSKYRYKLSIITPSYDTVVSETGVVCGDITIGNNLGFQSTPSSALSRLVFSSTEEAVLYEIAMVFNYWEGHPGQPLVKKEVSWSYGARPLTSYEQVEGTDNFYRLYYSVNTLFNILERAIGSDTIWDENHPNVVRYMDDFVVNISAAGEDFNNMYQTIQGMQNGLSLSTGYTNVQGGYGLFSSRIRVNRIARLTSTTKLDLFRKPWGFQEQ